MRNLPRRSVLRQTPTHTPTHRERERETHTHTCIHRIRLHDTYFPPEQSKPDPKRNEIAKGGRKTAPLPQATGRGSRHEACQHAALIGVLPRIARRSSWGCSCAVPASKIAKDGPGPGPGPGPLHLLLGANRRRWAVWMRKGSLDRCAAVCATQCRVLSTEQGTEETELPTYFNQGK